MLRVYLPPAPTYDQVRDVIVTGFLLPDVKLEYDEESDALLLDVVLRVKRFLVERRVSELKPSIREGSVEYGDAKLRVYPRLRLDSRLGGSFRVPVARHGVIIAVDWRNILYYRVDEIRETLRRIEGVLSEAPEPRIDDVRVVGHAYVLWLAAKLRGIDKDIRLLMVSGDGVADAGVIAASVYRVLGFVDTECLEELEYLALDALNGEDVDALLYLAGAVEKRDSYALKHMLRRMGCKVQADKLLTPADVLG